MGTYSKLWVSLFGTAAVAANTFFGMEFVDPAALGNIGVALLTALGVWGVPNKS